jgi:multisubunit Na+/H+ antiporter MnhC subunit
MNWDKKFFKGLLREADGTPSSGRFHTLLVVVFSLGWVTYLVIKNNKIPDLTGLAMFDAAAISALFGITKLPQIVQSFLPTTSQAQNDPR